MDLDVPSKLMPPLTIILVFQIQTPALKSLLQFQELIPESLNCLTDQHAKTQIVHPLWKIQRQHLPPMQKEKVTAQILSASPL